MGLVLKSQSETSLTGLLMPLKHTCHNMNRRSSLITSVNEMSLEMAFIKIFLADEI